MDRICAPVGANGSSFKNRRSTPSVRNTGPGLASRSRRSMESISEKSSMSSKASLSRAALSEGISCGACSALSASASGKRPYCTRSAAGSVSSIRPSAAASAAETASRMTFCESPCTSGYTGTIPGSSACREGFTSFAPRLRSIRPVAYHSCPVARLRARYGWLYHTRLTCAALSAGSAPKPSARTVVISIPRRICTCFGSETSKTCSAASAPWAAAQMGVAAEKS